MHAHYCLILPLLKRCNPSTTERGGGAQADCFVLQELPVLIVDRQALTQLQDCRGVGVGNLLLDYVLGVLSHLVIAEEVLAELLEDDSIGGALHVRSEHLGQDDLRTQYYLYC
jgi:hypothetical protein